ncbi:MAG: hypothetical protein FJW39_25400 [Acidobacteria bacterium]|nr:hypothetical protein [Acidobacteriota bacterium]
MATALWAVATTFVQAQEKRNEADYYVDPDQGFSPQEVESHLAEIRAAFKAWGTVRDHPSAQEFLLSLLGPKERLQTRAIDASKYM